MVSYYFYKLHHEENVGANMISGAAAGVMEMVVMYPVDTVKVSKFYSKLLIFSTVSLSVSRRTVVILIL